MRIDFFVFVESEMIYNFLRVENGGVRKTIIHIDLSSILIRHICYFIMQLPVFFVQNYYKMNKMHIYSQINENVIWISFILVVLLEFQRYEEEEFSFSLRWISANSIFNGWIHGTRSVSSQWQPLLAYTSMIEKMPSSVNKQSQLFGHCEW